MNIFKISTAERDKLLKNIQILDDIAQTPIQNTKDFYSESIKFQNSVNATRYNAIPCSIEYSDLKGRYQNIEIEARGDDGSYVRGFTTLIMGEKE